MTNTWNPPTGWTPQSLGDSPLDGPSPPLGSPPRKKRQHRKGMQAAPPLPSGAQSSSSVQLPDDAGNPPTLEDPGDLSRSDEDHGELDIDDTDGDAMSLEDLARFTKMLDRFVKRPTRKSAKSSSATPTPSEIAPTEHLARKRQMLSGSVGGMASSQPSTPVRNLD